MIIDCFTQIWDSPSQLHRSGDAKRIRPHIPPMPGGRHLAPSAGRDRHLAASSSVDTTIVVGFKSAYLDAEIPNDLVAGYVQSHPDRLIGFAGIDPSDTAAAIDEMVYARDELGMKGYSVAPAAQGLHPCDSKSLVVYERAAEYQMPMLFLPGIHLAAESKLEYARPVLLDQVAREFPKMRMIVAHMGYPWVAETLVLLAKHDRVFADISWLLHQPWEAYQALLSAYQYGVMDKLLFASGFPFNSATESIESLYGINQFCTGTNLPKIPRDKLRGLVEREALDLLGIDHPRSVRPEPVADLPEDDSDLS